LSEEDFLLLKTPLFLNLFNYKKFSSLRNRIAQKYFNKIANKFDLVISSCNISNFDKKVIQIIGDFYFDENLKTNLDILPTKNKEWFLLSKGFLRKIYLKICDFISPPLQDWKKDLIVSNSEWTQKIVKEKYGCNSQVLYPPVSDIKAGPKINEREAGFVYIGRISPEKNIESIIEILKRVRAFGHNVHLHIVGAIDNSKYSNYIKNFCKGSEDWIFFEGSLNQTQKNNLFSTHMFGISARKNEPFGISVAEMAKAGCIVFVPDNGGQTEIISDSDIVYKNEDDAVEKITNILNDSNARMRLWDYCQNQGQKFSVDDFHKNIKKIVSEF